MTLAVCEEVKKFLVFNQPDLGEDEKRAVCEVIDSGWIGTGKITAQFEKKFAEFMKGGYAVGVSSCTMGLELALRSLNLKDNDEVITTPLTFSATLNSIINSNKKLIPVLADVDEEGNIDIDKANQCVTEKTGAFLPVHYSGNPCDLRNFNKEIPIVEDCAHAFGSYFFTTGKIKVFSFYANKNITCGEGGMVFTGDKDLAQKIRILSNQGLSDGAWARYAAGPARNYSVEEVGFKGNLPDILSSMGLVQLEKWDEMKKKRKIVWDIYEEAFGYKKPGQSMHFYPLLINNRDRIRQKLNERGIGTGIHYRPLHLEPAYQFLGYKKGDFPNAEKFGEKELSLPVSSKMTSYDAERIVDSIFKLKDSI